MTAAPLKYPVGIQTFSTIRENGYLYVDKTEYIYKLINSAAYCFLSRPRRFGKSLLLSTIEAYYQGRRELFNGLAIDSLATDWEPHPVLHLDLNSWNYQNKEMLLEALNSFLEIWEAQYGDEKRDRSVEERFGYVIRRAWEQTGRKVVVLIDEYDKPMLSAIDNPELADGYRAILKAFYGNLKSMDRYIQFAMLTGVTRFSRISIFSDLNNLRDISFEEDYSSICGITNREVDEYFKVSMAQLARKFNKSEDEIRREVKLRYDGYHFSENLEDVYNPFSLINLFAACKFDNYWFKGGTPTYLVKLLKSQNWNLRNLSGYRIDTDRLSTEGILSRDSIPTLFQTGYLTIKDYDPEFNQYILDYPNREVRESFLKFLVPYYLNNDETNSEFNIREFVMDVNEGRPEAFMQRLRSLIAKVPYPDKKRPSESHFQNALYLLFSLMGYYVAMEDRTSGGRIDLTVDAKGYVYIFEFKVDKTAKEAMTQILEKRYWERYVLSGKIIFLIGANFNTTTRTLDDFLIEER